MTGTRQLLYLIVLSALIISGCSSKTTGLNNSGNSGESTDPDNKHGEINNEKPEQVNEPALVDYFLPDSSKAQFKGTGNEYADLDIDYAHPYKNYVIVHENNGGSLIRYIYKIEDDQILNLEQKVVDLKEDFPSLQEIEKMKPNGIYLKKPFEVGTTFDNWEIVETDVTVETPYKTFNSAFVIESKSEDVINRKYIVEGYGEVKRDSVMKMANGEEYQVTSTLASVSQP